MAWREIPKSIEDILAYIPRTWDWKIKVESGKIFYWIPDNKHNQRPALAPPRTYPDYE